MPARGVGAVEALEHVRQVLLGEARARGRAPSASPSRSATSTAPPGGLHLTRVVEQVGHRAARSARARRARASARARVVDAPACRVARRARSTRPSTSSSSRTSSSASPARVPRASSTTSPTSAGQLVQLLDDVGPQRLALVGRQPVGVLERLDVGPQAGDRRAQLVAGVGDQLALGVDRALERVERGVEAAGQPGELVVALDLHALGQVGLGGEASVRRVKRRDRRERGAGDHGAQRRGQRDARRPPTSTSDQQDAVELVVDLVSGRATCTAPPPGRACGEHPQVHAVDLVSAK